MKKILLLSFISIFLCVICTGEAFADDTLHVTLLGANATTYSVVEGPNSINSGNINPSNGNWIIPLSPKFTVTTNKNSYRVAINSTAQTFNAMADAGSVGNVNIALAKIGASSNAVSNAISPNPSVGGNPNVIAYKAVVTATSGAFGRYTGNMIVATATKSPNLITINLGTVVPGTFSISDDSSGYYYGVITCTASDL